MLLGLATGFVVVAACSYVAGVRRTARINAIKSYAKGERDCRLLVSMYLVLAAKEQAEASKPDLGSELQNRHLSNVIYYRKMAEYSYRIAESNAQMIKELKHKLNTH